MRCIAECVFARRATGFAERVAAFGGDLEVGPRPGGGFRVAARLPVEADGSGT